MMFRPSSLNPTHCAECGRHRNGHLTWDEYQDGYGGMGGGWVTFQECRGETPENELSGAASAFWIILGAIALLVVIIVGMS